MYRKDALRTLLSKRFKISMISFLLYAWRRLSLRNVQPQKTEQLMSKAFPLQLLGDYFAPDENVSVNSPA